MLTVDHLTTLRKPFRTEDHEFLNERAYITEGAITTRIEEVDPAWSFSILNLENRDKQIVATVRLTICGVSRENTGMASITTNKDGRETNEAEKSAVTDALKRAARLFGIGRYLLDLPSNVVNADSMRRYLLGENKSPNPYSNAPAVDHAKVIPLQDAFTEAMKHPEVLKAYPNNGDRAIRWNAVKPTLPKEATVIAVVNAMLNAA